MSVMISTSTSIRELTVRTMQNSTTSVSLHLRHLPFSRLCRWEAYQTTHLSTALMPMLTSWTIWMMFKLRFITGMLVYILSTYTVITSRSFISLKMSLRMIQRSIRHSSKVWPILCVEIRSLYLLLAQQLSGSLRIILELGYYIAVSEKELAHSL